MKTISGFEIVWSKEFKSKAIWSNPDKLFVEKIKAWFPIPKINFVGLFIIISIKNFFQFVNYVTSFCNSVSNLLFKVENVGNLFFLMEPTQTLNLIALSLIVVVHAGVLALRLGISLGRN